MLFSTAVSLQLFVMVIIGGLGNIYGAVLGAGLVTWLIQAVPGSGSVGADACSASSWCCSWRFCLTASPGITGRTRRVWAKRRRSDRDLRTVQALRSPEASS